MISWHRGLDDNLLKARVAAVELLNIIRPVVAIVVYLTFVAHALRRYPHCRDGLRFKDAEYGSGSCRKCVASIPSYCPWSRACGGLRVEGLRLSRK
ncbi:hypothetical protein [Azorhizophilus paspali]|uniref:Uncharacterized protein n=1 Tax=Azorhizophilus paspali TaxID=69963 RepID=A0ABV6SQW4_AZOPA